MADKIIGIEMNPSYPLLVFGSIISTLLPFLTGVAIIKQLYKFSKSMLLLGMFFFLAAATEVSLYILNYYKYPSAWISTLYTLIEFPLIANLLAGWQTKPQFARTMRLSVVVYILFFVFIKATGLENFSAETANFITRPLALLLLTTFALLTLQDLWRNTSTNLTDDYRFWMLFAMALYYSTSLSLFAFMYTKNQELLIALFKIHAVVNIIHNLIFTIGVFKVRAAQQPAFEPTSAS